MVLINIYQEKVFPKNQSERHLYRLFKEQDLKMIDLESFHALVYRIQRS